MLRGARRSVAPVVLALALIAAGSAPAFAGRPAWIRDIERIVGDRPTSVAIGDDGAFWYRHLALARRPPASNEKLLLSMALLQRLPADQRIRTRAMAARQPVDGVLRGPLWLVGAGDPETDDADLATLADELVDAGLRRVRRVIGATTPFRRDWWAPGWKDYFPDVYIARPTALTYHGNVGPSGGHVRDPERRAARRLTWLLEQRGVRVREDARMRDAPGGLETLAAVESSPLERILRRMNVRSSNFRAEVLGKYLGRRRFGQPSIAGGARAIRAFLAAHGVDATTYDSSGLSYSNRITPTGIVKMLWFSDARPWAETLRASLPDGGEGTLEGRLLKVDVRAKTGTLIDVSALSGWVWAERLDRWIEFSILTSGYDDGAAKTIENQIVRIIAHDATDPSP